jgi:hypothetical protein
MAWFRRNHDDDNNSDAGSNENEAKKDKKPKSRKPPNTAFRQQRLLAYAPILTPKTVLPLFFALGIIFGPIGGLLLYASSKVCHSSSTKLNVGPRNHDRLHTLRTACQWNRLPEYPL